MQPQASSLGNDELVYQYLKTLFGMKSLKKQIFQVCNDSLTSELAPSSWKDIHVRLLPKKRRFVKTEELTTGFTDQLRCQEFYLCFQHAFI